MPLPRVPITLGQIMFAVAAVALLIAFGREMEQAARTRLSLELEAVDGDVEALARDALGPDVLDDTLDFLKGSVSLSPPPGHGDSARSRDALRGLLRVEPVPASRTIRVSIELASGIHYGYLEAFRRACVTDLGSDRVRSVGTYKYVHDFSTPRVVFLLAMALAWLFGFEWYVRLPGCPWNRAEPCEGLGHPAACEGGATAPDLSWAIIGVMSGVL